jgi:hypothetical protein
MVGYEKFHPDVLEHSGMFGNDRERSRIFAMFAMFGDVRRSEDRMQRSIARGWWGDRVLLTTQVESDRA